MIDRRHWGVVACVVFPLHVSLRLGAQSVPPLAQSTQFSDRTPVFFSVTRPGGPRTDASGARQLRRRIAVELRDVPLADALDAVSRAAALPINYSRALLAPDARVTLGAHDITVEGALTVLLLDAHLDVQLTDGEVTLVPRSGAVAGERRVVRQIGGVVSGRVTDVVTRAALDQVAVRVDGPGLGTVTVSDGRYTVRNVPAGTYHVTARRVGYVPLTKTVTVVADSTTGVDFALTAAPTKLNEVVTTAVGDQRRYEVGNTISTINADSITPTAPITSLTDLISARAPGVQVLETGGLTGSGEAIRIRGLSSLVLQNDPIVIVDGVRQDNSAGGDISAYVSPAYFGSVGSHPTPARLNDINFTDIQSIDILKGPSASTEYGTDAANGVVVITTKHGTAGRPQWQVSAEQTASEIPMQFPDGYYSWGHLTDATHAPVDCRLVPVFGSPASTAGTCAVDSVTRWNPLNHAATSIFGSGSRAKYDLSVAGGSDAVRYFVAGALSNETGVVQMPAVFKTLADTAHLGLPHDAFRPNGEQQRSARVNTAIKLAATADLTVTGSYLASYQRTPDADALYQGASWGLALPDAAHYYGYQYFGFSLTATPLAELSAIGSQNTNRVTGGTTANWRPVGWFVGHATVGLDHGSQQNQTLDYPLANAAYQGWQPLLLLAQATTDVYSVDLRGTTTAALPRGLRAVTSGGLQLVDTRTVGQGVLATNITATNLTLNGATGVATTQRADRQATLGGYGEEELAIADRLFLTGALRIDAGSGFGRAYHSAAYPKASMSWLAVSDPGTTVRVRGAFGESGVQPSNGAAATLYTPSVEYLGGQLVTTYPLQWPGNQHLRPERTAELEGGIDVSGWANRIDIELTGYSKTTRDALVNVSLKEDVCCYIYQENIGKVRNAGVEATVTAGLVRGQATTWDVVANASINHNRLLSLAPGIPDQQVYGGALNFRQAPGYPLYSIWAPRVAYADANHDGIIEANEVTLADSATYVGPSLPTREASVSTRVGLWRGAVTIGGLVDYRGGYQIVNGVAEYADYNGNTRQTNDPRAPLWLQARAVENSNFVFNALDAEDGSFLRVREISVTYAIPRAVTRALHTRSVSLTGAVRNLALWTRYTGPDPEVNNLSYAVGNVQGNPTGGGLLVNNDLRADAGGVPLARYWVVRLNVGL